MDLIAYLLSFLSYRVVVVCLLSVPSTHVWGLYLHYGCVGSKSGSSGFLRFLLFPFTGGNRHLVFQMLAWGMWALSALSILPVFLPFLKTNAIPIIPNTHVDVVSGASAAMSFMGALFMAKALLVYDTDTQSSNRKQLASPKSASAAVIIMGALLAVTGLALLLTLEYLPDVASRVLYCCLSLSCLLISASTTYGLGGFLIFVKGEKRSDTMWQFFQPGEGGPAFVATQAISWSLFSATIVAVALLLKQLVAGVAACVRCWALSVGLLMVATQAMLALSLLTYKGQKKARAILSQLAVARLQQLAGLNLPVMLMYLPVHFFFALWVSSFTFLPLKAAAAGWAAFLVPYYVATSLGEPHHTGCRRWPWLCGWMSRNIEPALRNWFGSVEVIRAEGAAALDPSKRHVFGFHPHGWYPTGAGFLPLMPSFQALMPGISPVTLSASVMFVPPFIKDVICWAGFRQVSRHSFIRALHEHSAVILCPGGQAEMVHTWKAFRAPPARHIALHSRHKGFCRLAMEQRAHLVPVLALGETLQLHNLWDMPALQQYTYKRFGFPVPYVMAGRWGVSPLPRKVPLVYVVGEAIEPPALGEGCVVEQAALDELHAKYFTALQALFDKYKGRHPEYKDAQMVLVD